LSDYEGIPDPESNGAGDANIPVIECCFLIVVDQDGGSQVVLDLAQRFQAKRPASAKDIYPAVANVVADFQALKTAEAVVNLSRQMAEQAALQAQMEQVRRNLQS
jgi:hypothetical protein